MDTAALFLWRLFAKEFVELKISRVGNASRGAADEVSIYDSCIILLCYSFKGIIATTTVRTRREETSELKFDIWSEGYSCKCLLLSMTCKSESPFTCLPPTCDFLTIFVRTMTCITCPPPVPNASSKVLYAGPTGTVRPDNCSGRPEEFNLTGGFGIPLFIANPNNATSTPLKPISKFERGLLEKFPDKRSGRSKKLRT